MRPAGWSARPSCAVGVLEAAAPEAAQHLVTSVPEHHEVGVPVAVDVQWVGTRDLSQVGDRRRDLAEAQGSADGAVVVEERRWPAPTCEVELVPAVAVAVECSDSSPDEVVELAAVLMGDA